MWEIWQWMAYPIERSRRKSGISSSPSIEECLTLQNIVTTTYEFHIHVPSPRLHVVLIVSMLSYFVNV